MKLKISFKNQLLALKFNVVATIIMIIILFIFDFYKYTLIAFTCYWGIFNLVPLVLHFKYYYINRGQEIIISENEIIFNNLFSKDSHTYDKPDIKKVELCRSAGNKIPIESYQHIKIFFKSGDVKIITNLMESKFDDVIRQFQGDTFVWRKGIFCLFDTY